MKKLFIYTLITLFSFTLSQEVFSQTISQGFSASNKFTVYMTFNNVQPNASVTCKFYIHYANGTIKDVVSVTEPSASTINFNSGVEYVDGMYFDYEVFAFTAPYNQYQWYVDYNNGEFVYDYLDSGETSWIYGNPSIGDGQ